MVFDGVVWCVHGGVCVCVARGGRGRLCVLVGVGEWWYVLVSASVYLAGRCVEWGALGLFV